MSGSHSEANFLYTPHEVTCSTGDLPLPVCLFMRRPLLRHSYEEDAIVIECRRCDKLHVAKAGMLWALSKPEKCEPR